MPDTPPTSHKLAVTTASAPQAIGPYSQAVRLGNLLFTSGQVALDPASGALVAGGVREQTERVLLNLGAVLAAAGANFTSVVKSTVYLKDMNDFAAMNEIYASYFVHGTPPARSTVEVARLPKDALVEIDVIATI